MVLENELPPFLEWLWPGAVAAFAGTVLLLLVVGLICTYLVKAFRFGPVLAFPATGRACLTLGYEVAHVSPRRVFALARLAFQESLRRKVLVAFFVFSLVLLLAGWFLDVETDHPAQLYLAFVLWSTNILIIVLAAVLSTMSLPADIKNRTIYTIVTKPVYSWEIVLGRILGFGAIGTLLLLAMGLVSYFFVVRGLSHSHTIDPQAVAAYQAALAQGETDPEPIYTSTDSHHRHELYLDGDGRLRCRDAHDHWHEIESIGSGDDVSYVVGPPQGDLQSRVTIQGGLQFLDEHGQPAASGVNVGTEWQYHSYIEGATSAAAIWTFDGITEEEFKEGLPLDLRIRVFRTYKGEIERMILGEIFLARPNPEDPAHPLVASAPITFESDEFDAQRHFMSRKQRVQMADGTTVPIDMFDDTEMFPSLVDDEGRIQVWVRCAEPEQYFGMAKLSMLVQRGNKPFELNFAKSYASLWCQMMLVICFGVMFSTFLNAPVALLATMSCCLLGFVTSFVFNVASGKAEGGGPIEAVIRIFTHKNLVTDLDQSGLVVGIIKSIDGFILFVIACASHILPKFDQFHTSPYLAAGYNIPAGNMAIYFCITFAFLLVVSLAGYVFLKSREIAS